MIKDSIKNAKTYKGLSNSIKIALDYLEKTNCAALEDGTYPIDEENVYAMIKRCKTELPCDDLWEAHRKYIDLQYVISGEEYFGVVDCNSLSSNKAYDSENDCEMFTGTGDFFSLKSGDFVILWPQDAHMPQRANQVPQNVEKVVIKIKI